VWITWLYEEVVELALQLLSDVERRVLLFFDQAGRDDYVRVNGPERDAKFLRSELAPMFGLTHRVFVADDEGRPQFVAELEQAVVGIAAEDESDLALCEGGSDVGNAFGEEAIVADISVWIKGHRCEVRDDGLAQRVARLNGDVERGIVNAALRPLHPVDDAQSLRVGGTIAAEANAGSGS